MLSFDDATFAAWLSPFIWPFLRVLAMFQAMPIFRQASVPGPVKIGLAFFVVLGAQVSLPAMPTVPLDAPAALAMAAQQVIIGLSIGFAVRLVFAGVELAGELIGLQMGLNFSGFFDPSSGGQTTAISRFYGTCIAWVFLAMGGHLAMIAAVIQSFQAFPVSDAPLSFIRATAPHLWGAELFKLGLWISLPMIAMLLFTNLTLGIISRIAPQMNVFSIGFPVTLSVGLLGMLMTLPMMDAPFRKALETVLAPFS